MLTLATQKSTRKKFIVNPTAQDLMDARIMGLTPIEYDGVTWLVDLDSGSEREQFKQELSFYNHQWFREETGKHNWVLYNEFMFSVAQVKSGEKVLRFDANNYKQKKVEIPFNASSLCGMFSWMSLPEDLILDNVNTRHVVDMSLMYAGSILPENFEFPEKFDLQNLENTSFMFYKTLFLGKLNINFKTPKLKYTESMFSRTNVKKGVYIGDGFSTAKVENMASMFQEADFHGECQLGKNLVIPQGTYKKDMFKDCKVNGVPISQL